MPTPVVHQHRPACSYAQGLESGRRHRDPRLDRHRAGRSGPLSSIAAPAPAPRAGTRGVLGFLLAVLLGLIAASIVFPRIPQFVGGQPFILIRDVIVSVLGLFLPAWI